MILCRLSPALSRFVSRFWSEERGDQNVSMLGLMVVAVAVIGLLLAAFRDQVPQIIGLVFDRIRVILNS